MPHPTARRRALLLPLAAGASSLVACGGAPGVGDYRDGAADFIADGLEGQAEQAGITFTEPACDEPPATETGTVFACTASGSDGTVYTFTVTIVGRNRMDLVSAPPLPVAATTATTTPGT